MHLSEQLVDLHLDGQGAEISAEEAFACIEAAKSRSMIEMIFQSGQSLPLGEAGKASSSERFETCAKSSTGITTASELEQLRPEKISMTHRASATTGAIP